MPKHQNKAPGFKPNSLRKVKGLTLLGLHVTATSALSNPIGRVHKRGQLFAKTRKPGV